MARFHLAQLNVARAVAPLDDPRLQGFVALLDEINALGEASPGFVWRLAGDNGNATGVDVMGDPRIIANLTLWESIDQLWHFTYRSARKGVFARRFDWFERSAGPSVVLWWHPAGTVPTLAEALRRLELLAEAGPTPEAFTFNQRFPAPAG